MLLQAWKSWPKCNKLPCLVTLDEYSLNLIQVNTESKGLDLGMEYQKLDVKTRDLRLLRCERRRRRRFAESRWPDVEIPQQGENVLEGENLR